MSENQAWHAAVHLASSHPEQLLARLTELQSIPEQHKQFALDGIGEALAVAAIERPTLAECREALAATDASPRARRLWTAQPVGGDIDETLIAFVLDALGSENDHRSAKPPGADRKTWVPHSASSAEQATTSVWQIEATNCTIQIERTESFFPGDVNEPASVFEHFVVEGARRAPPACVRFHATVGDREMMIYVDAPPGEHDQILAKAWRAFHS